MGAKVQRGLRTFFCCEGGENKAGRGCERSVKGTQSGREEVAYLYL